MPQDWEQALALIDIGGECPASAIINGIRATPPGRHDILRAWERIYHRVRDLAEAQGTLH